MDLINAAFDGNMISLNCALDAKVPVDVVTPVRDFSSCLRTEFKYLCVLYFPLRMGGVH